MRDIIISAPAKNVLGPTRPWTFRLHGFITFSPTFMSSDLSMRSMRSSGSNSTPSEPTISFEEQERIRNLKLNGTLENSRDWLLIGCQVGLRISDLLTLKKEMIVKECLIPITMKKVKKQLVISLSENIIEILKKRNGEFPPRVSHWKKRSN